MLTSNFFNVLAIQDRDGSYIVLIIVLSVCRIVHAQAPQQAQSCVVSFSGIDYFASIPLLPYLSYAHRFAFYIRILLGTNKRIHFF